jgi:hypothetical protein
VTVGNVSIVGAFSVAALRIARQRKSKNGLQYRYGVSVGSGARQWIASCSLMAGIQQSRSRS